MLLGGNIMYRCNYLIVCALGLLLVSDCFPMTYDNQFFPLGAHAYTRKDEYYSNLIPELFGVIGDRGVGREGGDVGLFELFGNYDLNNIAAGLQAIGQPNPLRSEWQGSAIPWRMNGRIEALGADLYYNQAINRYVSCGASILLMNVKTWIEFKLDQKNVGFEIAGPGDFGELDRDRLQANTELGLSGDVSNRTGFGDLDLYIRFGHMWYYPRKFRRIDFGTKIGVLAPTGKRRNINNPASIPFAGDGRWGLYSAVDIEFELKEDIKVGLWAWVIGRFPHTGTYRVPTGNEPYNFGAIVGTFRNNPLLTFVAYPYFLWEDIRHGFGAAVSYLCVRQFAHDWEDKRVDKSVPANLELMRELSSWTAEYISVNLFYDLSRRLSQVEYAPTFSLCVDVPVNVIGERKVSRTNRLTLGVEFKF